MNGRGGMGGAPVVGGEVGVAADGQPGARAAAPDTDDPWLALESILRSLNAAVFVTSGDGLITSIGGATRALTGRAGADLLGRPITDVVRFPALTPGPVDVEHLTGAQHEAELVTAGGSIVPVLVNVSVPVLVNASILRPDQHEEVGVVFLAIDQSERRRLELELRHAQRLEAIGQLAAGVAHEINTPIQFVGDSARFLGDVITDVMGLLDCYQVLRDKAVAAGLGDAVAAIDAKADEIDLGFLLDEAPRAVVRTLDGISRISTIVNALKQFSHPGGENMGPADLNQLIENTLVVSKNEYKYVADMHTDLGPLPEVTCNRSDIGQVLINLVVNAAHALQDRFKGTDQRGEIRLRSFVDPGSDGVVIEVADTGGGIPAAIRDRVFEPFFTTKEVGRGTGQGLAISHNVVVVKHQGKLTFDVDDGVGTTFRIWLPIGGPPAGSPR